jgi:hypothetical protein
MNFRQSLAVGLVILGISMVPGRNAIAQTRIGLHVTQEELAIWKQRAASGPYKTKGDVSTNSPGDWTRIQSNASAFLSNPSEERWSGQTQASCVQNGTASVHPLRTKGEKLRDAAFTYLITNDTRFRDAVKSELLAQAATSGTNWTDSTRWCKGVLGNGEPIFEITLWLSKILLGYDYIRSSISESDRKILDNWFLSAGLFIEEIPSRIARMRWPNRDNDDYSASQYPLGKSWPIYYGGPNRYDWHGAWENHAARNIRFVGLVGIMTNNDYLKRSVKRWYKEWMKYFVWHKNSDNIATNGEYYRSVRNSSRESLPNLGWGYASVAIGSMISLADTFARVGDTELYDYTTSAGYHGTEGGPKNLKAVMITHLQMMTHTIKRYGTSDPDQSGNPTYLIDSVFEPKKWYSVGDTFFAMANNYYRDNYIRSIYTRTASSVPSYHSGPASIGCSLWQGEWCLYSGTLFMFGQMEGKVWPYPGRSTPSVTSPAISAPTSPKNLQIIRE